MKSKKNSTRSISTPRAYRVLAPGALIALVLVAGVATAGRGTRDLAPPADPLCAARVGTCLPGPYVTVLSAFPAELAPLLAATHVTETIVAGGEGQSEDPFGGSAFACMPGGGQVFGCDEALFTTPLVLPAAVVPDATDMETAAVARVARDAGVPYVGFRGVSDGGGDPLGLPGFPAQFFAYYRLSADNAAATATAFLAAWVEHDASIAAPARVERVTSSRSHVEAACDWERAASLACAGA